MAQRVTSLTLRFALVRPNSLVNCTCGLNSSRIGFRPVVIDNGATRNTVCRLPTGNRRRTAYKNSTTEFIDGNLHQTWYLRPDVVPVILGLQRYSGRYIAVHRPVSDGIRIPIHLARFCASLSTVARTAYPAAPTHTMWMRVAWTAIVEPKWTCRPIRSRSRSSVCQIRVHLAMSSRTGRLSGSLRSFGELIAIEESLH